MKQSGKKRSKFYMTLGFTCNADGSEKLPSLYIEKYKHPWCFRHQTPEQQGLYYCLNKKTWMTSVIFNEYVTSTFLELKNKVNWNIRFIWQFDMKMHSKNWHILLIIDNFSGHYIDYAPTNIQIKFFEPNLTFFVQPLDVGIIRCFKAHYQKGLCLCAIDHDDEGAEDIFDLNLLEGMKISKEAWDAVSKETVGNTHESRSK